MNQNWDGLISLSLSVLSREVLLSSDLSHHYWVNALKMRWVGKDLTCHLFSIGICSCETGSKMIFDVT
jgi:hypothetical protein